MAAYCRKLFISASLQSMKIVILIFIVQFHPSVFTFFVCHSVRWKGVNFSINELNNNGWTEHNTKRETKWFVQTIMLRHACIFNEMQCYCCCCCYIFTPIQISKLIHSFTHTSQVNGDDHDNGQIIKCIYVRIIYRNRHK